MILFGSGVTDLISPDFGFPTNVVRASNSELFGIVAVYNYANKAYVKENYTVFNTLASN